MKRSTWESAKIALSLGLLLLLAGQTKAEENKLPPKKTLLHLQQHVIPSYEKGNPEAIYLSVSELAKKLSEEQFALAESYIQSNGFPALAEMLATSLIDLIRGNW